MNGKILIDRKILDWEWWSDVNTSRVFFYLILIASWRDTRWKGQEVKRGTVITSLASLVAGTNLTPNEVRTAIKHLLSTGEITKQSTNRNTLIYIVNYDYYQTFSQTDDKPLTNESQTINKPLTTSEEDNKDKESKKVNNNTLGGARKFVRPSVEEVQEYCNSRNNGIDGSEFVDFYESKGWKIGKDSMKDWKAAVRTWERKRGFTPKPKEKPPDREPEPMNLWDDE
jgi:hypothetical protein